MTVVTTYTTITLLKAEIGVTDTVDDTALTTAVAAASRQIDKFCDRRFYLDDAVSTRRYKAVDGCDLFVDDIATATGLVVAHDSADNGTFDVTWTAGTDYELDPVDGLRDGQPWPYTRIVAVGTKAFPTWGRRSQVRVTATWGWAAVPDDISKACLVQAAQLYKTKDTAFDVAGTSQFGTIRVLSGLNRTAATLAGAYQRMVTV